MTRWFRFYSEALDDPKVQLLSGDEFKLWVNMLCLACRGNGQITVTGAVAFSLRVTFQALQEAVAAFEQRGLLDACDGNFEPHNWSERQYKSDTSSERVGRYRERKRNVTVTPPDYRVQKEDSSSRSESEVPRESIESDSQVRRELYSETELRALAFEFDGLDVPAAVAELERWCERKGIADVIERKNAIYGGLRKRHGKARLVDEMKVPEDIHASPQLASSRLTRARQSA